MTAAPLHPTAILEDALPAYIECALWSSTDGEQPMDELHTPRDLAPATFLAMLEDVAGFIDANREDCGSYVREFNAAALGHDLWLTRNRHGAGFWDRGVDELGERLTAAADTLGEVDLYVGDDGLVHAA